MTLTYEDWRKQIELDERLDPRPDLHAAMKMELDRRDILGLPTLAWDALEKTAERYLEGLAEEQEQAPPDGISPRVQWASLAAFTVGLVWIGWMTAKGQWAG